MSALAVAMHCATCVDMKPPGKPAPVQECGRLFFGLALDLYKVGAMPDHQQCLIKKNGGTGAVPAGSIKGVSFN